MRAVIRKLGITDPIFAFGLGITWAGALQLKGLVADPAQMIVGGVLVIVAGLVLRALNAVL